MNEETRKLLEEINRICWEDQGNIRIRIAALVKKALEAE